jgi:hypothetical protein
MKRNMQTSNILAILITVALAGAGCSDKGPAAGANPPAKTAATGPELAHKAANTGLEVTLQSSTGTVIKATADEAGKYAVPDLAKGEYDLIVSSGERGHITHGGGRWEGKVTVAAPATGEKKAP